LFPVITDGANAVVCSEAIVRYHLVVKSANRKLSRKDLFSARERHITRVGSTNYKIQQLSVLISESTLPNLAQKLFGFSTSLFHDLWIVAVLQHHLLEHEFGSILWFETPHDKLSHACHERLAIVRFRSPGVLGAVVFLKLCRSQAVIGFFRLWVG
jgi:hypothetical protein